MWTQSLIVLLVCGLTGAGGEIGGKFLCTPDEFRGRLFKLPPTESWSITRYTFRVCLHDMVVDENKHLLYKMSVYVVVGSGRGSCHGQRVD